MLNCSTSNRPPNSTTVSKICSMMWESMRWPCASTRSCRGSGLPCAGMVSDRAWDLVSKLPEYPLLEGKFDFEAGKAQEVAVVGAEGGAVFDGEGRQVSVND